MNTSTATTSTAASVLLAAPRAEEQPAYRYAGDGRFLPANQSAIDECAAWNRWADTINARTAATRSARHDH